MASINRLNGGIFVFAIETEQGALRGKGKGIVTEAARKFNLPVVVVEYDAKPPTDTGSLVVLADHLRHRARAMIGLCVGYLAEGIGIYKLVSDG
jgi:hypothetical protein